MRRKTAILVIVALLFGVLPSGSFSTRNSTVKAAGNTLAGDAGDAEKEGTGNVTGQEGYGLHNPKTDESGVVTWDCVYFGNYWQMDTNRDGRVDQDDEKQPIKWRVLSVDGDDVFLLAEKDLDCRPYNTEDGDDISWETCTLRSWLNGYGAEENKAGEDYSGKGFLDDAFTSEEKFSIKESAVINDDNLLYGTEGGNNTSDRLYLLSIDESMNPAYGFPSDHYETETRGLKRKDCWLRSPGCSSSSAAIVCDNGCVSWYGSYVYNNDYGVRPALHMNLKASSDAVSVSSWSYAGTVSAEGGEIKLPVETPGEFSGKLKSPVTDKGGTTTWDTIYFGNYWQEDTNGDGKADKNDEKQPIRWRVLSVDGDDVFLLAEKGLDCRSYGGVWMDESWETCTLRSWLNGYGAEENKEGEDYSGKGFLNEAFTTEEKSYIKKTTVVNDNIRTYGTQAGNDTLDQVYLLSIDENMNTTYGFPSDSSRTETRKAQITAYARRQGVNTKERPGHYGCWWLRSGSHSDAESYVYYDGNVYRECYAADYDEDRVAVRPVLHLDLKASSDAIATPSWSYAGTVSSEGGEIRLPVETPGKFSGKLKSPVTDKDGTTTWDTIYFGSYWQEDTNGDGKADENDEKQPIRWRVLSVDGDDVFLLADKSLDSQPYNYSWGYVPWETCTMRSWLNGYGAEENELRRDYSGKGFLNEAFTTEEKSFIKKTKVVNDNNPVYGTEGGNDGLDQVCLLSIDESMNPAYGFPSDSNETETRKAQTTAYVRRQGVNTLERPGNHGGWWLRSKGRMRDQGAFVYRQGDVHRDGGGIYSCGVFGVRPALHLDLKASSDAISTSSWSYAGTVSSEGGEIKLPVETPGEFSGKLKSPVIDKDGTTTWDTIYFGSYWQEDTNGDGKADKNDEKQPIRWRVLSADEDDVFLLAEKGLEYRSYDTGGRGGSWKTCTLRSWLNGYGAEENKEGEDYSGKGFLNEAFTTEEQSFIKKSDVVNDDDINGTEGENNTSDQLYLLSIDESMNPAYGFPSENNETETRKAQTTAYVRRQGVDTLERPGNYGGWWLRSIGFYKGEADNVKNTGLVPWRGLSVHLCFATVRPVLHLNLKASSDAISTPSWSYAGTVTLKGRLDETATPAPADTAKPSGTPIAAPTVNPLGTTSPAESKKPDAESTVKPMATPTPAGTVFPIGSPSPAESKKPDEGSTVKPMVTPTPVGTTFPAGSPSPVESKKPDEGLTAAPTGTSTAAPGTTLSQPDPVLQPTAAPVPVSVGKVSSVGRVSSFKLKQKKRTVTVSWKKVSGADGYQICYSTSKKWKKKTRKLTANMKVEIKKLKKKKTYYFRVRAYRKDGAKKIYGAWSNTRKMKIRK